jgi:DNA-binding transcriptional ArsR family regulator
MGIELSPATFQRDADLLKALGHPIRLCILKGLLEVESCNVSYMQACLSVPQSTLSQHISVLRNAGIVAGTRDGLVIHYRIIDQRTRDLLSSLFSQNKELNSTSLHNQTI